MADRITNDDRSYREDVRITRDETSRGSYAIIAIIAVLLGIALLYWAFSPGSPPVPASENTTIIMPAPTPAPAPPMAITPPAAEFPAVTPSPAPAPAPTPAPTPAPAP